MNITPEIVTLGVGFITILAFFINRQDTAIKNLRGEFKKEQSDINERIDVMKNNVINIDDFDRLRSDIKEMKADITKRLDQNHAIIQTMQRDFNLQSKERS